MIERGTIHLPLVVESTSNSLLPHNTVQSRRLWGDVITGVEVLIADCVWQARSLLVR